MSSWILKGAIHFDVVYCLYKQSTTGNFVLELLLFLWSDKKNSLRETGFILTDSLRRDAVHQGGEGVAAGVWGACSLVSAVRK